MPDTPPKLNGLRHLALVVEDLEAEVGVAGHQRGRPDGPPQPHEGGEGIRSVG